MCVCVCVCVCVCGCGGGGCACVCVGVGVGVWVGVGVCVGVFECVCVCVGVIYRNAIISLHLCPLSLSNISLPNSLPPSLHSLPPSFTLSLVLSLSPSLLHSLPHSLPLSFTPSLPPSLSPSLLPSLLHSLPRSLPLSFPPSLPHVCSSFSTTPLSYNIQYLPPSHIGRRRRVRREREGSNESCGIKWPLDESEQGQFPQQSQCTVTAANVHCHFEFTLYQRRGMGTEHVGAGCGEWSLASEQTTL